MKRAIIVLFLIGIFVLSSCTGFKGYRGAEENMSAIPEEFPDSNEFGEEYVESEEDFGEESSDEEESSDGDSENGERTQEEIFEETGCDVDIAIDKIFELAEQNASDEEVLIAMCELDCEELNPADYVCPS